MRPCMVLLAFWWFWDIWLPYPVPLKMGEKVLAFCVFLKDHTYVNLLWNFQDFTVFPCALLRLMHESSCWRVVAPMISFRPSCPDRWPAHGGSSQEESPSIPVGGYRAHTHLLLPLRQSGSWPAAPPLSLPLLAPTAHMQPPDLCLHMPREAHVKGNMFTKLTLWTTSPLSKGAGL